MNCLKFNAIFLLKEFYTRTSCGYYLTLAVDIWLNVFPVDLSLVLSQVLTACKA